MHHNLVKKIPDCIYYEYDHSCVSLFKIARSQITSILKGNANNSRVVCGNYLLVSYNSMSDMLYKKNKQRCLVSLFMLKLLPVYWYIRRSTDSPPDTFSTVFPSLRF